MGRRAIVLLVALILAGLAAWAVWQYLQEVETAAEDQRAKVTVFRAGCDRPDDDPNAPCEVADIAEGAEGSVLITDFNANGRLIVESQEEKEDLPSGAITDDTELRQVLSGKVAAGPIPANSVLTAQQWTTITEEVIPLAQEIPSGKQAMTISVDNVRGVNGFVEPGDRINMIITLDISFDLLPEDFSGITIETPGEETGGDGSTPADEGTPEEVVVVTYTRYVLQGLPVIATGRDIRPDEDVPQPVETPESQAAAEGAEAEAEEDTGNATIFTLEVTPEEAERIAYAFENGSIWLTLVPEDFVEVETNGVIIDNLFGGDLVDDIFGTDG
jgi:Flp pilus assembly protein CpaB